MPKQPTFLDVLERCVERHSITGDTAAVFQARGIRCPLSCAELVGIDSGGAGTGRTWSLGGGMRVSLMLNEKSLQEDELVIEFKLPMGHGYSLFPIQEMTLPKMASHVRDFHGDRVLRKSLQTSSNTA
jgi:hypothetical protein